MLLRKKDRQTETHLAIEEDRQRHILLLRKKDRQTEIHLAIEEERDR